MQAPHEYKENKVDKIQNTEALKLNGRTND